jgi:hypothetical protein
MQADQQLGLPSLFSSSRCWKERRGLASSLCTLCIRVATSGHESGDICVLNWCHHPTEWCLLRNQAHQNSEDARTIFRPAYCGPNSRRKSTCVHYPFRAQHSSSVSFIVVIAAIWLDWLAEGVQMVIPDMPACMCVQVWSAPEGGRT